MWRVGIIVLNWNGREDTLNCLESLKGLTYPHNVILVDNGSTDGLADIVRGRVELIENEENLGFAAGCNQGIKRALEMGADFVLFLNNDTLVAPDLLEKLLVIIEDQTIGVVGPTVYEYDQPSRVQSTGYIIDWNLGRMLDRPGDVDCIHGCCLLAKASLFEEVGLLKEAYFAYWEETEWCVRVKKAGYRVVHVPDTAVWHKGAATSGRISGFYRYQMIRNSIWFMREHAGWRYYIFLVYLLGPRFLSSIVRRDHTRDFCRAVKDGMWPIRKV